MVPTTAVAQSNLIIMLNGMDSEWNVEGWVCPGDYPCQVPTQEKTAWLCCNTTGTPRKCQLVWKDEVQENVRDLKYVRIYFNQTGVYAYVAVRSYLYDAVGIRITRGGYELRIFVNASTDSLDSFYRLSNPQGNVITQGYLGSYLLRQFDDTYEGLRYRGVEIVFKFAALPDYIVSQLQSGTYGLSVGLNESGTKRLVDIANVGNNAFVINLELGNWHTVSSYYNEGGTSYPIPIPEPGLLVSAATVVTALGVVAYTTASRRRS
ncbi:MAG: hypothetical protein QW503_06110 [Sulfolobales archaeon]